MKTGRMAGKTWRTLWQSVVITTLAVVAGLLTNLGRSDTLPLVADWSPGGHMSTNKGSSMFVSLNEARDLCVDKGAVFLDARSPEDYARGHIRCALNLPWQSFDTYMDRVWNIIPEEAWIVIYCDGETCSLSEDLARELVSMGYQNVRVFVNGWTKWREAGLPVERGNEGPRIAGGDDHGITS